jgi:hypothetical protein
LTIVVVVLLAAVVGGWWWVSTTRGVGLFRQRRGMAATADDNAL